MKKLEKTLKDMGFNKLQEKEDCVYYESYVEDKGKSHQTCIVYDKKKKKIKSMDTYSIKSGVMEVYDNKNPFINKLKDDLQFLA